MFCTVTLKEGICCTISLNTWLHTWTPVKVTKGKQKKSHFQLRKHDSVLNQLFNRLMQLAWCSASQFRESQARTYVILSRGRTHVTLPREEHTSHFNQSEREKKKKERRKKTRYRTKSERTSIWILAPSSLRL